MATSVTIDLFKDNTDAVIQASEEAIQTALMYIGEEAEGFAKEECPVDTGALRNSIAYATADAMQGGSEPKGQVPKKQLQVGTNIEYAKYQEFGEGYAHTTGKAHFLRDSIANHGELYKEILEAALED